MDYDRSPPAMFDGRALNAGEGPSNSGFAVSGGRGSGQQSPASQGPKFDIIQWYPQYQSCLRYFVEVSQHSYPCQALAAFINIKLPFQRAGFQPASSPTRPNPPPIFRPGYPTSGSSSQPDSHRLSSYGWVSLHPYIRRLVASGFDVPAILHGWFGDDWVTGIGPLHEQERRNYLFAAKSGGWAAVKRDYDNVVEEAIPYLKPLSRVEDGEIHAAEGTWSRWLAMEDWMLGNRAPVPDEADTMAT